MSSSFSTKLDYLTESSFPHLLSSHFGFHFFLVFAFSSFLLPPTSSLLFPPTPNMGKTFNKIVACSTGDHPGSQNEHIKKWVENNGGRFTKELDDEVTHLICSKQAWQRYHEIGEFVMSHFPAELLMIYRHPVKQARRRRIQIVRFRWLEDSLMRKGKRPLKTTDPKYSWEQRSIKRKGARMQMATYEKQPPKGALPKAPTDEKRVGRDATKADKVEEFGKDPTVV